MIFRAAFLHCLAASACALLLANCSTTAVSLDYQPSLGDKVPGPRKVSAGNFVDRRGEGSFYLGTVRTPIGTPLESINTRIPVDQVVRNAFAHGLGARSMLAGAGAPYILTGEVLELHCDQVVRPAAYAKVRVSLIRSGTKQVVFSRIYNSERENNVYLPGSGSPVPMLRELASRVLQDVVDRALDDSALRARLTPSPYDPGVL